MKKLIQKIPVLVAGLFCCMQAMAQSNPAPFDMSGGASFEFKSWPASSTAGTYPANMVFHRHVNSDPSLNDTVGSDYSGVYNATSQTRIVGLDTNGFAFINTSTAGNLGTAVVALNTTGKTGIAVSFIAGTVTPTSGGSDRIFAFRLQYRPDTASAWTDVTGPVEYVASTAAGDFQSFGPVNLPVACENQPNMQLRWKYYMISGTTGNRPLLRIDDIVVSSGSSGADLTPPQVLKTQALDLQTLRVIFSEPVGASADSLSKYTGISGLNSLSHNLDTVVLSYNPGLQLGQYYTLTLDSIRDTSGNLMAAAYSYIFVFNNSQPSVVITEMMYNDPTGTDTLEFIELYNAGTTDAELGGFRLANGIDFQFPQYILAAGQTVLVADDSAKARSFYNKTFFQYSGSLSNGGEKIELRNTVSYIIDEVEYDDQTPWPTGPVSPDGGGSSMEVIDYQLDNNQGSNWKAASDSIGIANVNILATPGSVTLPVTPSLTLATATVSADESADSVIVEVSISSSNSNPTTVDLEVIAGSTATEGSDFTIANKTVTFPASATGKQSLKISISNDALAEETEYFGVKLVNAVNGKIQGANNQLIFIRDNDIAAPAGRENIRLELIGSYVVGSGSTRSSEISAYDSASQRLFVVNSVGGKLEILDVANPAAPTTVNTIDITTYGGINSVAVYRGLVACAIEGANKQANGAVVFFDTAGNFLKQVTTGAMPDMITFSPDGKKAITANEGEPSSDYTNDPEGSVSVVDLSGGISSLTQSNVTTLDFTAFNSQENALKARGVRIYGVNATLSKDLEPEYVAVSKDSRYAWVTLQENNALAFINLQTLVVDSIVPLGFKDHSLPGNGIDASDKGSQVHIANWPVKGMYLPDAMSSFEVSGQRYVITANEGDAREYSALDEQARVGDAGYLMDSAAFPNAAMLKSQDAIGRLRCTKTLGDTDKDGDFDEIYTFGGRSFTIWNAVTGQKVYDSGNELERITSTDPTYKAIFNASNDNSNLKNRSDDKGPEPEGITVASINDTTYAFVTLERIGGVVVYDISNPASPVFVQYVNNRSTSSTAGDQGPEGVIFIAANASPTGKNMLVLSNEVSSTVSFYEIDAFTPPTPSSAVNFAVAASSLGEAGGTRTVTLNIAPAAAGNSHIVIGVANGTDVTYGTSGDYTLTPSLSGDSILVNVPAGSTSVTFTVNVNDDAVNEDDETVTFNLRATGSGLTTGTTAQHVFTIVDDEPTLGVDPVKAQLLVVYPNPASHGEVFFSKAVTARLYDMNGREVRQVIQAQRMDISGLNKGAYVLLTESGEMHKLLID